MIEPTRPRVSQVGNRIHLTCQNGHYLAAIDRRDWAGSLVESMAGRPVTCRDCAEPRLGAPEPAVTPAPEPFSGDRNETIARIRAALRQRTGRAWSVTGGRGTSWGWIKVTAPPARRVNGEYGHLRDEDRAVLAEALGLENVHPQGVSIPASHDYRHEYVDRAEGRAPSVIGEPYWD